MKKKVLCFALLLAGAISTAAQHTYLYQATKYYIKGVQYKSDSWHYFTFSEDYSIVYESDKYGNASFTSDKGNEIVSRPNDYQGETSEYYIYKERGDRFWSPIFKYHVAKDLSVINSILLTGSMTTVYVRKSEAEKEESVPQLLR